MAMVLELHKKHPNVHVAAYLKHTLKSLVFGATKITEDGRKSVAYNSNPPTMQQRVQLVVRSPALIRFPPGRSPQGGDNGKCYVSIPVTDPLEQAGITLLDHYILDKACGSLDWWPERKKQGRPPPNKDELVVTMGTEEGAYQPVMKPGKENLKSPGTHYQPVIKAQVPMDPVTGEALPELKVVNLRGEPISLQTVVGRTAHKRIYELRYGYFMGGKFGPVKCLVYLQVSNEVPNVASSAYEELDALDHLPNYDMAVDVPPDAGGAPQPPPDHSILSFLAAPPADAPSHASKKSRSK